ncbi:hypothetical protein M1293_02145 [Candidatus Parvarchaeota archaeon]|nr:hypothetical protein [Candidatus Parvarchaeota archaeon]
MIRDIKKVIKVKEYASVFLILSVAIFTLYFYLLESSATGIIDFKGYYIYFDLLSAVIISILVSLVITLNVYSYRIRTKTSKRLALSSIIGAILPSSLCCTSIVPSLMAVFGFSTSFIIGNTGKVQSVFSTYGPAFIAAGAIIAFFGLIQITKNINKSCDCEVKK